MRLIIEVAHTPMIVPVPIAKRTMMGSDWLYSSKYRIVRVTMDESMRELKSTPKIAQNCRPGQ